MKDRMPFFLKRFFLRFYLILRTGGFALLILLGLYRYFDQNLTALIQDEIFSEEGMSSKVWIYASMSLAMTLVFPVATTILTVGALKSRSLQGLLEFSSRKISDLVREHMRALGMALLWGIPLVIPTFWKLFQFVFVPLIVCMDPQYPQGNIHAPSRSAELVRRRFWMTSLVVAIMYVIIPLTMTGIEDGTTWAENPGMMTVITLMEFLLTVAGQLFLIRIWEKAHGSDFQVA